MMAELAARARKIELLLLDVDGVLTDGSIIYTAEGDEIQGLVSVPEAMLPIAVR